MRLEACGRTRGRPHPSRRAHASYSLQHDFGMRAPHQDEDDHHVKTPIHFSNSRSRSRGGFSARGLILLLAPANGERSAERRSGAAAPAACCGRPGRLRGAPRPSAEGRAPLGAPPWRFWAGGRASISGISSGSVQRCSSRPGRSAWRAGSRASRGAGASRRRRTPLLAPPSGSPLEDARR